MSTRKRFTPTDVVSHARLRIRVTTKAAHNRVREEVGPDKEPLWRVDVTVAAENGKANAAVIKLLAEHLDIAKSRLKVVHGLKDRNKIIEMS